MIYLEMTFDPEEEESPFDFLFSHIVYCDFWQVLQYCVAYSAT